MQEVGMAGTKLWLLIKGVQKKTSDSNFRKQIRKIELYRFAHIFCCFHL